VYVKLYQKQFLASYVVIYYNHLSMITTQWQYPRISYVGFL